MAEPEAIAAGFSVALELNFAAAFLFQMIAVWQSAVVFGVAVSELLVSAAFVSIASAVFGYVDESSAELVASFVGAFVGLGFGDLPAHSAAVEAAFVLYFCLRAAFVANLLVVPADTAATFERFDLASFVADDLAVLMVPGNSAANGMPAVSAGEPAVTAAFAA